MKSINKLLIKSIGICSALLLASCCQDVDILPTRDSRALLTVKTVSIATDTRNADTKASVLPTPITTGALWTGIRALNSYAAQKGLIYTYNSSGQWICNKPIYLGADAISMYAYWPQAGYTESNGMLTLSTQPYLSDKDLCYALSGGENVCFMHPSAGFVLKPAYARIKVDLSFSSFFENTKMLNSVALIANGLKKSATLTLESGVLTPTNEILKKLEWTPKLTLGALTDRKFVADMLVVPSLALTSARLSIYLDDVNYGVVLGDALTKLEAGKSYRIKMEIKTDPALIVKLVTVEDWITDTPQNGNTEFL